MEYDCEWVSDAGRRGRCFGYAGGLRSETVGMAPGADFTKAFKASRATVRLS
jgi:hypothetical protein